MSKRTSYERSELGHTTTKRAKQVDENLPYDQLQEALGNQDEVKEVTKVAHWFHPKDLRIQDNTALHHASELSQSSKKPLVCVYINCAADESWHGTSPARVDFMCEGLQIMQKELKELNIPLVFLECEDRKKIVPTVIEWLKKQKVSHVFGNLEYEIDELRRDIKLVKEIGDGIQVSLHHDQTVIEPGTMTTGSGKPMKIFTPYHKTWLSIVKLFFTQARVGSEYGFALDTSKLRHPYSNTRQHTSTSHIIRTGFNLHFRIYSPSGSFLSA